MIDIPWTNEMITRIYNEKMAWINNAKLSPEERDIEIPRAGLASLNHISSL